MSFICCAWRGDVGYESMLVMGGGQPPPPPSMFLICCSLAETRMFV